MDRDSPRYASLLVGRSGAVVVQANRGAPGLALLVGALRQSMPCAPGWVILE